MKIEKIAARLTEFGVASRFSGFIEEPTKADAQQAYENAIIIKEFVLKNFFN